MSNLAPAFLQLNPSYTLPEVIMPYSQASGAYDLLADGGPLIRLGEGDLVAYINRIDVRTRAAAGRSAYNLLPSCDITVDQIQTSSYLLRNRAEYDHHDTAAMARRGIDIVSAQRLAMRNGHFNLLRIALLYGFSPNQGEGLVNTHGATALNLPPDQNGNDTVLTYDNGEMAFFLSQQVQQLKTRTNQLGIGHKFVICGPQRTLGPFEYNVVQLTQFQRSGAGSNSTTGTFKDILSANGDTVLWVYDDTLIGKGNNGADLVVLVMPEVENPQQKGWNTNEFAKLKPGLAANTLMLSDMAAPKEISVPLAGGAIDVLSEIRATSGWGVRPETITLISMIYQ